MANENPPQDNHSALISIEQHDDYSTALQVARQLNAEFNSNKDLTPFNALNLRDEHVLPVVAAVSVAGAILTGIAALIAVSRRAERQITSPTEQAHPDQPPTVQATTSRAIVL